MSEKSPPAVGIDLGTTFSAIAHLDDTGRPVTLVNGEGDLITPSVVLIDGEDIVVGKEAVKALSTEAQRVAVFAKRDMGRKEFHEIVDNRRFPPEVLQAMVLRKVVADAQRQIGEFRQAVVTVPAYFDEVRRKATQDAGYMAGIEVLDIINEPTAAAISFGHQQGFLNERGEATAPQKILVYDLGGGTFDVSLMELKGTQFITLAVDGDSELGGRDWDYRLMHYVAEQFLAQHGADPREDPAAKGKLWRECEDAKRTLSARNKARVTCDFRGMTTNVEITREKFEEITHDLVDRTRFTTRQVLQAAKLDWGSVDRVLLVGGSSRMPMVRDMLRQLSGKVPDDSVSADEAVAHGAALHAGLILAKSQGQPAKFHVRNVNSHSLGVVGVDPQTGRKRVAAVIPRNTPLPVAARRTFRTQKAGQDSILVQIVEGESPAPDACTQIGRCVVRDLPANLPAETPIEVRFEYAPNGRLAVKVKVANTDKELHHELHRDNSLNAEQLEQWRTRLAQP